METTYDPDYQYFYDKNPEFIIRNPNLFNEILDFTKKTEVSDEFGWYREICGPIMIPYSGEFFLEFIMRMLGHEKVINIEPFDRDNIEDQKVDLLEVVSFMADVIHRHSLASGRIIEHCPFPPTTEEE